MALQGTIDTFPITDVLTLLSSSSKNGKLTLTGDRGTASIWLTDSTVLGGQSTNGRLVAPERAVFELLMFSEGAFEFASLETADLPDIDGRSAPVADCVDAAQGLVAQWAEIASVVPSVDHRAVLVSELPSETVTIDRATWGSLMVVARCGTVYEVGEELGVDEYEASVIVARLVEAGLVGVYEPLDLRPSGPARVTGSGSGLADSLTGANSLVSEAAPVDSLADPDPAGLTAHATDSDLVDLIDSTLEQRSQLDDAESAFPEHFPIDDLLVVEGDAGEDLWSSSVVDPDELQAGERVDGWDDLVGANDPRVSSGTDDATEEVLRQMAQLSPTAAEAIAAALATTDYETDPRPATRGTESGFSAQPESFNASDTEIDEWAALEQGSDVSDEPAVGPISYLDSF